MQYSNFSWRNGQPYSENFDDIYYSSNNSELIAGESEFSHVFFKNNGLPQRWHSSDNFVIAELGFGSGLNCMLTIRQWLRHLADSKQNKRLHYIAIEKYPLSPETIVGLVSRYPQLNRYYDELIASYPPAVAGAHSRFLFDNRVVVHYRFMDAYDALKDENFNVDAWYLDGFSPAKNPDMWSAPLFEKLAQNSHTGTTCSTYTSAGFVKRNLQSAGFNVNKVSGCGNKREILQAELKNRQAPELKFNSRPWFVPPLNKQPAEKKATIIGAGIAGLTLAHALVKRDWDVTLIDKDGAAIKQASSNPAPIVYPRLSVNNDVDTEFYTAAYCYALHLFETLQKRQQRDFWFGDGITQLMDKNRITRIVNKFQFNPDFIALSETKDSEQLMVDYPSAGVVLPAILTEVLKKECADKLKIIDADISQIKNHDDRWLCFSGSELVNEAEILIVANGTQINNLGLPQKFPVEAIRGQVAILNASPQSSQIRKTVNADVHITPQINGKHYLGATYNRHDTDAAVNQNDTAELLVSLNRLYPGMFSEKDYDDAWAGFRTVSKDRVPIAGAVADEDYFREQYADICHGKVNKNYPPAHYLNGLFISAAHGSRGFTSSFLCAEIIAAQIEGEPMPVSRRVVNYLNPSRFIINQLKRGSVVIRK